MQKFYVNADGTFAGSYVGLQPEDQSLIEVTEGPISSKQIWDFEAGAWSEPVPTQDDYTKAIQAMLEKTALSRRYEQGATAFATYVNSKDTEWAAEAQAFVAWRDTVWLYAYQQLDAVQAGDREQPSVEELLAELPEPTWPDAE